MKLSKSDYAVLFLLCGILVLICICAKTGETKAIAGLSVGALGCGIMLYASHHNKKSNS